ncbi:MAG TPA: formimidoyltetrahydrofolate cyclodeaminase [Desulfotomaculum sp.]|nr:formimidoyltetrahydrofolate cyclodeaminase [Desulfotomaculum sp.]
MKELFDLPLRKVIELAASREPTPGGGSISALAGCLGLSMTAMVGHLTSGKNTALEEEVKEVTGAAQDLITKLEIMIDLDIAAFTEFMATYRLPRNTPEEKKAREEAKQKAFKKATDVPLETAAILLEALTLTRKMSHIGSKMAISDVGVAAHLCAGALEAVLLCVDINLLLIKEEAYVAYARAQKENLVSAAQKLKAEILATVQDRLR